MEALSQSGLSAQLAKAFRPLLRRLLPRASRDEGTLAAISANVSANLLGLGNAATPLGIRAVRAMARGSGGTADDELCLTASGADEALALQRSADANASQLWRFGTTPDEYTAYAQFPFQLEPKCAPGMRLQIKDGSNYYGAKHTALIEEASGAKYQNMYFDFAEFTYEDGQWCCWYYIRPANSNNNVLATHSNSSVAGTDVHLYYKSQTFIKSIEWRVEYLDEGYCRLIPRANRNVALNVAGSGSVAGTNVNVQTIDNSAGQSWRLLYT